MKAWADGIQRDWQTTARAGGEVRLSSRMRGALDTQRELRGTRAVHGLVSVLTGQAAEHAGQSSTATQVLQF